MRYLSKFNLTLLLALLQFSTTNCKNDDPDKEAELVCGVKDPIRDLKWLNDEFKQFIGGPTINGIVLYEYNGNQIIEVQSALFSSTNMHQYRCDGTKLNFQPPQTFADYQSKRKEMKVLYGTKIW